MSIASEITRLQLAKADIKTAIENKGVTVAEDAKLDSYAGLVDEIGLGVKYDIRDKLHTPLMISGTANGKLSFIFSDGTTGKLFYSRDLGNSWTELSSEEEIVLEGTSAPIMFSGNLFNQANGLGRFSSSTSAQLGIYGNPESLWKGGSDGSGELATNYKLTWSGFYKSMFSGLNIGTLSIILGYTNLSSYCYENMFQNSEIGAIENLFPASAILLLDGSLKGMFMGCISSNLSRITLNINGMLYTSAMESMFEGWNSRWGGVGGYSPLISIVNLGNTIPNYKAFKRLFYGSGVTMVRFGYTYNTGSSYTPDSGATEDWLTNLTYGSGLVIGFDWWDLSDLPSGWTLVKIS